jgi:hypothetical protein
MLKYILYLAESTFLGIILNLSAGYFISRVRVNDKVVIILLMAMWLFSGLLPGRILCEKFKAYAHSVLDWEDGALFLGHSIPVLSGAAVFLVAAYADVILPGFYGR